jgi:ubiquinone/menaquinone biosynthesis C-methylase UbiE
MLNQNASFYDDYYGSDDLRRWRAAGAADKADHILALCGGAPPATVLEVGCGDGAVLAELSRRDFGEELSGVEISASGVAAVKERRIPRLVSLTQFDGYSLPFSDRSVDLVYSTHVLEHVEHERLFLRELARVGRSVFIEVPLEDTLRVAGAIDNDIGHINFYNRVTFKALLQEFFTVERLDVFDHSPEVLGMTRSRVPLGVRRALRNAGLRLFPSVTERIFVYHAAALCRPRA